MVRHGCTDGTLDESNNYASPVALIGLYIAGAMLVCFIFVFCDIWVGFCQRKRWLPCKLFSLNSLTLTLLSIVAKLPVDLTSPMPNKQDQLSKLTGTTTICVCMEFFLPSLGTMGHSECFSNMAALTIFVVTLIANICIQIGTGVIFSFIVEHIIISLLMLVLLMIFWNSAIGIMNEKERQSERVKEILVKGKRRSMLQRLKLCYVYSYMSNPQLVICRTPYVVTLGVVSTVCTLILSEVVFRSLVFKKVRFCRGESDYKWSMWIVVATQLVTVLLVFLGNFFRWVTLVEYMDTRTLWKWTPRYEYLPETCFVRRFTQIITGCVMVVVLIVSFSVAFLSKQVVHVSLLVLKCVGMYGQDQTYVEDVKQIQSEFKALNIAAERWILTKGVDEMNRWIAVSKTIPLSCLKELFSKFCPPQEPFSNYIARIRVTDGEDIPGNYRLSCLSMVMLVREAANVLPDEILESLESSLAEAFEIIYFIDKKINVFSFWNKQKLDAARGLWEEMKMNKSQKYVISNLDYQYVVIVERSVVDKLITSGVPLSDPEGTNCHVQKLFVAMLNWFLVKLPKAVLKDVVEGPWEYYTDRVKDSIVSIQKLELLENEIKWKFPGVTDITDLITMQVSETSTDLQARETSVDCQVIVL